MSELEGADRVAKRGAGYVVSSRRYGPFDVEMSPSPIATMPSDLPDLNITGTPVHRPTDEVLDAASRALGLSLPRSYHAFVQRYGYGLGATENGDIVCWDPERRSENGEYDIYLIGARKYGVRLAAADFAGFLKKALEPAVGGILARATFQLEPTFEPRPARS